MKKPLRFAVVAVAIAAGLVTPQLLPAQDATEPGPEEPVVEVISSGLWKMNLSEKEISFTPPDLFKPEWSNIEFDVFVHFCRAMSTVTGERDGEPFSYDDPYGTVPDEEGKQLAEQLFTGRMTQYPWTVTYEKEDALIPRTHLERSFLRVVLKNLDTKNTELTDAQWADPKQRLGIVMNASGFVEIPEGPEIFRMVDTSFHIFSRKGVVTVLSEDDYYMWTLRGDTSLTWPRDQERPAAADGE